MELKEMLDLKKCLEILEGSMLFNHSKIAKKDFRGNEGAAYQWICLQITDLNTKIEQINSGPMSPEKFQLLLENVDEIMLGSWVVKVTTPQYKSAVTNQFILDMGNQLRGIGSWTNKQTGRSYTRNGQSRPMTPNQIAVVKRIFGGELAGVMTALLSLKEEPKEKEETITLELMIEALQSGDQVHIEKITQLWQSQNQVGTK